MKKLFTALTILSAFILASCGKEDSIETGGGGGNTGGNNNGALLVSNVAKISATDSLGYKYAYDNNRRISNAKFFINVALAGLNITSENRITRNTNGVITAVTSVVNDGSSTETINYNVNYNSTNSRYTSKVATYTDNGTQVKDSTAYTFDAAGKVTKEVSYYNDGSTGGYLEYAKTEFTYDASGNLSKYTYSEFDPSTNNYQALTETTLEYDAKVNPIKMGNEAFVLGMYESASNNNVQKSTYVDFEDNSNNEVVTFTYTYNGENKPSKAETTFSGLPLTFNYTYQ